MDIRTKLVFALVALALGSMLTLGAFMYASADRRLDSITENKLEAIAVSSETAIEEVLSGWRERVQLIASRTQLRISLREYNQSGSPTELARIERILEDALTSVRTVRSLGVYDLDGRLVASAGEPLRETEPIPAHRAAGEPLPDDPSATRTDVRFRGVTFDADRRPRIAFAADLRLDGETLGEVLVILTGSEVRELTREFPGLGETGEILIVIRHEGAVWTLHPLRHGPEGRLGTVRLEGAADPILRALNREEDVFEDGLTNFRGEYVWAATRHIEETGWGVVVKFDDAEEQRTIDEFRSEMTTLALSLSAFAILFAVLLGFRFATPIHHLAEVANRIRDGALHARASVKREDEIGLLARTFNQMAEKLEDDMIELHKYHKFFEVSLDLLCIAGTDGYFKRVNPAFERTLGWSTEALLERPFMDLVHPDDVAATAQEIEKLAQGIPTISFVNRFRCADGAYKPLRWTSHPEPDGTLYAVARELKDVPTVP